MAVGGPWARLSAGFREVTYVYIYIKRDIYVSKVNTEMSIEVKKEAHKKKKKLLRWVESAGFLALRRTCPLFPIVDINSQH